MLKQPLESNDWTLRVLAGENVPSTVAGRVVPATVPGCVHTALLAAGLIDDPYVGTNELAARWIGACDWEYRCTFQADARLFSHDFVELACDGLDTIAEVFLNGTTIGASESMHVAYRFNVRGTLKPEQNELVIRFASPVKYAYAMQRKIGPLPYLNHQTGPFNFIRKMACNFGWDWGPGLPTSGIWRGIRIEAWNEGRIAAVRTRTTFDGDGTARVVVSADIEGVATVGFSRLTSPDGKVFYGRSIDESTSHYSTEFTLPRPSVWWPIGHGRQPLYRLSLSANGETVFRRLGMRTAELDTSPDDVGRRFVVKLNGKPIFCKGFNWIPDDVFLDRACTRPRYERRLRQAAEANANMLRVWGGGLYETDDFYDVCDELGLLVWQDCLFACAAYPEEEPFRSLVEAELRSNVPRLRHHASLVLWNGCNENVWGFHDWGWHKGGTLDHRTWGTGYYFDLVPRVLKELDDSRPYWPASPFSGEWVVDKVVKSWDVEAKAFVDETPDHPDLPRTHTGLHPNAATHGNKHVWEAWFGDSYEAYRRFSPRFCSEFGFQAPPTFATLSRAVEADQLQFGSTQYKQHQKSPPGDANNDRHLTDFFESPANFDDRHYLLQLNQARALTLGVEWFRSRRECAGTLYWQLNDCWPSISWSAIDGDGRFKPLYFATRRFFAPRLLTIQPDGGRLVVFAINDSDLPWQTDVDVAVRDLLDDGVSEAVAAASFTVEPRSMHRLDLGKIETSQPSRRFLVARAADYRALWFFDVDKRLNYPRPQFQLSLERDEADWLVQIDARSFIRDLCFFVDRLDPEATIDDQLVTLLPGDRRTLRIASHRPIALDTLRSRPVLQMANWYGANRE